MNRLCLIPLIVIMAACVSSPAPSTPTAKIETFTAVPATKTPTPTNTIVPTPTRDPTIPEGYTEDASGNYTKTENGFPIIWDAEREAGYSLMFDDFLWDIGPDLEGAILKDGKTQVKDSLKLKVWIDSQITNWNKLTVSHAKNMDKFGVINWTVFFQNSMWREMGFNGMLADGEDFSFDRWFGAGYEKDYTTKDGPEKLIFGGGNVTTVHIRADYEALKAAQENNNFTDAEGSPFLGSPSIRYMVKISSDADGNTLVEIAPNITNTLEWKDPRIVEMYLYGLSNALCNPDALMIPRSTSFSADLAKNHANYPYFIFARSK